MFTFFLLPYYLYSSVSRSSNKPLVSRFHSNTSNPAKMPTDHLHLKRQNEQAHYTEAKVYSISTHHTYVKYGTIEKHNYSDRKKMNGWQG